MVSDLASLHEPSRGKVELPLRLYWSAPKPVFDLEHPAMRRWLYQIVLREASRPEDLIGYLDRGTLIDMWPEPHLPKGARQAWEEAPPEAARRRHTWHGLVPSVATCTGRSPRSHQPRRRILADDGLAVTLVIERCTCPC